MLLNAFSWLKMSKIHLLVLIIISLSVGSFIFTSNRYESLTLVLEARTLKKGLGTVTVESAGSRGGDVRNFELLDDQGVKKMYVIELPAVNLKSIKIAPLAPSGEFALERIILSNAAVSYYWDEHGQCSRQTILPTVQKREACGMTAPVLATAEDSSVVVSSIPEEEFANPARARIAMALILAFGTFAGGIWLLRSCGADSIKAFLQLCAVRISWLMVAALFAYQLYLVSRYAVQVPYEDEWEYFSASSLSQNLPWQWLFSFHVEHRIVLTKLIAWLNLKLLGLDFVRQDYFNMFLFGGLLALLNEFKNRVVGRESFQLFPLFLIFLLSSIGYENHLWAFQSQYHLVLIFSVAALYYAFSWKMTNWSLCLAALCMIVAMYTFSAGVVFSVVYLLCLSVYIAAGIAGGRIGRRAGWRQLLIVWSIVVAGFLLWTYGYVTPAWSPPKLYPSNFRFWDFYLNMIGFGFGFNDMNMLPGIAGLLFTICPLFLLLFRQDTRWQPSTWQVLAAILAILASLAAVTVGRGNFGMKLSRHAEIGFMLIPYAALAWWLVVRNGCFRQKAILVLLWLFCFGGYFNDWSTQKHAEFRQINMLTLECVEAYFNGVGDGACQGRITFLEIERAKTLDAIFTRQFTQPPKSLTGKDSF